ncbi:MAG: hypothetical protein Edafosvirus39_5 [Edafosvirus sp.]|uniref:Uncharacterized protein n=1 Tax=Edafosvirus sp. TaxID=2487765 RepID=A0A3G4ZVD1_9VIRU|nr:MAG: hypothetical protein Edafosvirus39_5 [Edafosvirus sp.]
MSIVPKKLAIYYSYPSIANGSNGNIASAVAVFQQYDLVVLGSGLELATHPDHLNTISIINDPGMANTTVFGYIDSTLSLDVVQGKIDLWNAMSVKGIFLDKFGYDFGNTRLVQRELVWCVQAKGLKAFVNAFNVDDAFSSAVTTNNPNGLATRLGANDWYLAESFAIINGAYDDNDLDNNGIKDFQDKAAKMSSYHTTVGTNMAAVATADASAFDQNKADYSYYAAVLNNFQAWGYGEQYYSASSASMPFRTRKAILGTHFTENVVNSSGIIERTTNIGIHVDTNAHTVSNATA